MEISQEMQNAIMDAADIRTAANMVDTLMCERDFDEAHRAVTILLEVVESRLSQLNKTAGR